MSDDQNFNAMGCSLSTLSKSDTLLHGVPVKRDGSSINDRQKVTIKKTWKIVSGDIIGIGSKIFLKIFTIKPAIKQIFPFRDVSGDALLRNTQFRSHASRFMQAIGASVDNIYELNTTMAPLLFSLGQQHGLYKGFNDEYFDVFSTAIIQVLEQELGTKFTSEVSSAWSNILEFIIGKLREGYQAALQK